MAPILSLSVWMASIDLKCDGGKKTDMNVNQPPTEITEVTNEGKNP